METTIMENQMEKKMENEMETGSMLTSAHCAMCNVRLDFSHLGGADPVS